jgi:methyltransferase (TIGR00027 family)
VQTNIASMTAENNAAVRALEATRPPDQRICHDPQAKYFLADHLFQASDPSKLLEQLIAGWEMVLPGICNAILARTRLIDEVLARIIGNGLDQLVILGAGYDTRALRFDMVQRGVRVFELDHPATQTEKLRRLKRYLPSHPPGITYIPIFFGQENLRAKLSTNGYDSDKSTFFIWEGVTYYLPAAAVDDTLAFIAKNAPTGSAVAFDYFPSSVAAGFSERMEARALYKTLKQRGEELRFGLDPEDLNTFLNRRGFQLIDHLSAADCKQLYFPEVHRNRQLSDIFTFVHARVKGVKAGNPHKRKG